MKMQKSMLPANTSEATANEVMKVYDKFGDVKKFEKREIAGAPGVFEQIETPENKQLKKELMKTILRPRAAKFLLESNDPAMKAQGAKLQEELGKASVSAASGFDPYDLQIPSHHLVPWLSPIRESLPRTKRPSPGNTAHWKSIINASASYTRGGAGASPYLNEGQRAPLITLSTVSVSQNYVTIGKDGSVTYEAESGSEGFEDALASAHFFTLETLMVAEEDSLIGGNKSMKLGTASTPTGTTTGSGSFSGSFYAKVIGLTYEGYRNFVLDNGLAADGTPTIPAAPAGITQQKVTVTPDNKTMTVNTGVGIPSAASSVVSPSSSVSATFSAVAKTGEVAWAWFLGTANTNPNLYLVAITTVPTYTITAAPSAAGQQLSTLNTTVDFSVNDGSTGGGVGQVTAYDGLITQAFNNTTLTPQNAYLKNLAGALLTTTGRGNVVEIDNMLLSMWNLYKVTVDKIYVNAQEMQNITNRVLNTTSAPLLRAPVLDGGQGGYKLTANGVISYYYNPYIPGGAVIPIIIHPTLPPGTILAMAEKLPPYFKTNSTPMVVEVLERRPYYSIDWAMRTREYEFGVYAENAGPAVYAPFCLGLITGVGNG